MNNDDKSQDNDDDPSDDDSEDGEIDGKPHAIPGPVRQPDSALTTIVAILEAVKSDPYMWFMHTEASHSTCKSDEGMVRQRKRVSTEVVSSTGQRIPIIKRFDLKGTLMSKDNKRVANMILKGVNHAPGSAFNLFSVARKKQRN